MKRIGMCIVFVYSCAFLSAQSLSDSVETGGKDNIYPTKANSFSKQLDKFSSSSVFQMTYIGVPLIVGGLIVKSEDDHFRNLRNDYLPRFNRHVDDYMQYVPAAVMFGMKAAGVQSRSSWRRMIASDAFSAILMGCVVNTLKLTTNVERPDGSNRHSFPSGHTAMAFMTATMLNKEYGHKNPWIGIGAYSVATATGLMRMANNKHWLSDVLTGAGIGILSTEVGYYLADLIFKEKGISRSVNKDVFDRMDKSSFLSLYLGLNVPLSGYDIDDKTEFRTSSGSSAGIEGAYFFNPYIGLGGRLTVSNTSVIVNDDQAENNTFDIMTLCSGAYLSYPLSSRWLVGSKILGGYVHYPQLKLTNLLVPARNGFCMGSGVSLTFKAKEHYGVRFFLDYDLLPSHSLSSGEYMNMLTLGSSFMITL